MVATAKSKSLARDMAGVLEMIMGALSSPLAVVQSTDTDGYPLIKVGTGSIGAPGGLIKINAVEWSNAQDSLGNSAIHYGPHRAQIVLEANPAGGAGADINTWAVMLPMIAECVARGVIVEIYQTANGNAPDVSDITGVPTARWGDVRPGYLSAS